MMKNWSLSLVLAAAMVLIPAWATEVNADPGTVLDTTLESSITASGDNTTDNATQTKSWWLRLRGVPGKGILTAPGLQKPFNPNWKGFLFWTNKPQRNKVEQQINQQTQNSGEEQELRIRERTRQYTTLQEDTGTTEQTQNQGEEQRLNIRERTRQELQLQEQAITTQQTQNHGAGEGAREKGKGKKGQP